MKKKNKIVGIISACLVMVVLITVFGSVFKREKSINTKPDLETVIEQMVGTSNTVDYDTYISEYSDIPYIEEETMIPAKAVIAEGQTASFDVNTADCLANIKLSYKIISDNDTDGSCEILINNLRPFKEAAEMPFKRRWYSGDITQDGRGNQYTVPLFENEEHLTTTLYDSTGFHTAPLYFHFNNGKNKISITSNKGDIELVGITLSAPQNAGSYAEISKNYKVADTALKTITIESEMPYYRSNASITELCDRTSPATTPAFDGLQIWNSLGGSGFSRVGQYVTFKTYVPETGYYKIAIRFKNSFKSGVSSYRCLYIDGAVPFAEMESVRFPYGSSWQTMTLADKESGEEYLYYLESGEHTLTLEVTLGEMAQALNVAQKSLSRLNEAYRKIVMVTGASPDTYRDYEIEKKLPDMLEILREQKTVLTGLMNWLTLQNGGKGEGTSTIEKIVWQLKEFIKYPESIPQSLGTYTSNLSALSDWIQSSTSQPLTIDKIQLLSNKAAPSKNEASFIKRLYFGTRLFIKSFADDYGVIGSVYDDKNAIDVWLALGRDQYQIIKEHSDNYFTKEHNTGVNLKLISGGILNATIAGIAPDVYLFADEGTPVNFASRGALYNLASFEDYEQVASRFSYQAIKPFSYDGGVYGLPLTQNFEVMFTRDDVLAEIGLEAPETWEDVYNCLTVLQQHNMEFAIPSAGATNGYALLLFRNQKDIYKNNGKSVAIDTEEAIQAFADWTELYSKYSLLQSYSFVNRFRSGDMPIGITTFDTFNTLEVSAPEISGLWSMHPVPGTVKEDGTIEHVGVSTGTAAIILKATKKADKAWAFLNWFTDEQEQYRYATAIENKQGVSGRFPTANKAAFNRLSWSAQTIETLNLQRETSYSVEQVPGGYFLSRHINNIFRKIVNQKADVRETVTEYSKIINEEITKKRREFGLEVDK